MTMKKTIDFPPYTEAEVVGVAEDGSVLCNLYGVEDGVEYRDQSILFPPDSVVLRLTDKERAKVKALCTQ